MEELDRYWNDLLFNVTQGNASEMMALRRFDIMEFFGYVENKMRSDG